MSLVFDGVDSYVTTANNSGLPSGYPLTMACVVKVTASAAIRTIIVTTPDAGGDGYAFYVLDTDKLRFGVTGGASDIDSAASVPEGAWIFLAHSSASATSHRQYCFNYETVAEVFNETSTTNAGAITAPSENAEIGITNDKVNFPFNGSMAWLALYSTDMTGAGGDHLRALARFGPRARQPGVLWPFWQTSGTTASELITANSGTLTNFPASPWEPMSLPGPWWERRAARVIRPQAAAVASTEQRRIMVVRGG